MNDYKDLVVWQRAMDLVDEIYRVVKYLPKEETYALSDQMRRCCVSIPSNIAEGYGRNSRKEYLYFLSIANGSKAEMETQLMICVRQKFLTDAQTKTALSLCSEIGKMLNSMLKKLTPNPY